jgi:hypothetical protein
VKQHARVKRGMGERGERRESEGVRNKGAMQKSAGTEREEREGEGEKPNRRAACRAGRVARCTYTHTDRQGDREAGRVCRWGGGGGGRESE